METAVTSVAALSGKHWQTNVACLPLCPSQQGSAEGAGQQQEWGQGKGFAGWWPCEGLCVRAFALARVKPSVCRLQWESGSWTQWERSQCFKPVT